MNTSKTIDFLSKDLQPVKPLTQPYIRLLQWVFILIIAVVAGGIHYSIRPNFSEVLTTPRFIVESTSLLLSVLFGLFTIFRSGIPGQTSRVSRALFIAALCLWVASLCVSLILNVRGAGILSIPALSQICIVIVTTINLLPVTAAFLMAKRNRFHKLIVPIITLAVSASLSGAFAIQFICPATEVMHIVFWHAMPALFTAIVSIAIGFIVLKRI